jgi:CubicO group peptidase (beta-lactamase class C family)
MEHRDANALGLSRTRLERVGAWLRQQADSQRLAGASVLIARHGDVGYFEAAGMADLAQGVAFSRDTLVRIYSMTKPITTVAAMMLYEQGYFQLDDPVSMFLPEFADARVWRGGDADIGQTDPLRTPITVAHLMTHTSGLTYGFMRSTAVDARYREAGIDFAGRTSNLSELVGGLARIPLLCQPGSQWNYSVSTDVLGRLVEVWSGQSLADYLQQSILSPLGMLDTGFHVQPHNHARFASLYEPLSGGDLSNVGRKSVQPVSERGGLKLMDAAQTSAFLAPTPLSSGGGGLTGSIDDYARFCQMLLAGGEFEGVRLLGRKTVEFMRLNQLPDNRDMAAMGQPVWSETSYDGIGFGLGFAVVLDPVKAHIITSPGEHHWGGAASTFFWIDPAEDLFVIFFAQLMPSSTYPIRRELRARVYQALT